MRILSFTCDKTYIITIRFIALLSLPLSLFCVHVCVSFVPFVSRKCAKSMDALSSYYNLKSALKFLAAALAQYRGRYSVVSCFNVVLICLISFAFFIFFLFPLFLGWCCCCLANKHQANSIKKTQAFICDKTIINLKSQYQAIWDEREKIYKQCLNTKSKFRICLVQGHWLFKYVSVSYFDLFIALHLT